MCRRSVLKCILLIVLCSSLLPLLAQPKIVFLGMNALVPGSAELALGNTNRGVALLASELLAFTAYLKTASDMDLQKDAYRSYAHHYAGVDLSLPQSHFQAVQEYYSSEDFNKFQEMMARNYFVIYQNDMEAFQAYMAANSYEGLESWEWQSPLHWETYKDMRRKHQKTKINHTLALGIMLLNRAIGMVDIAILKTDGGLQARPHGADGVLLSYELHF